jgi:hypothetical protein
MGKGMFLGGRERFPGGRERFFVGQRDVGDTPGGSKSSDFIIYLFNPDARHCVSYRYTYYI